MPRVTQVQQSIGASTLTRPVASARPQAGGLIEIAILSLAGLALSLSMIAARVFPDALTLLFTQ